MAWKPLERASYRPDAQKLEAVIKDAVRAGLNEEDARRAVDEELQLELWNNLDYQVAVRRVPTTVEGTACNMVHLSIKRIDRKPIRDWRHMQKIKNQLVGEECEMVELYPAESRLVDTANQYHLWGIDMPGFRWPVGFNERAVLDNPSPESDVVQRPFE